MTVSVKICGLRDEGSLHAVIKSGADYAGFVHHLKSPRHVTIAQAKQLKSLLPDTIKSVMVVVNPSDDLLTEIAQQVQPDFFQLHGEETPERLNNIHQIFPNTGIIKAIAVRGSHDIKNSKDFYNVADFIMFDAKTPGSGTSFDWSLLAGNAPDKNWFLSGGLNPANVKEAIAKTGAKFVDVSSGVESNPGVKDAGLIEQFVKAALSCYS